MKTEDWEVEVAKILGASLPQIENVTEDELDKLLPVTDQSLNDHLLKQVDLDINVGD